MLQVKITKAASPKPLKKPKEPEIGLVMETGLSEPSSPTTYITSALDHFEP